MPRPQRCRRVCSEPEYEAFAPASGIGADDTVVLTVDAFEAIRLIDLEGLTHEQCAAEMQVSRTTVTEIYEDARYRLADCLVHGKRLVIAGGRYRLCSGASDHPGCARHCPQTACGTERHPLQQPKGENIMRIAVTYENGSIFQHFGHTAQFKLYDVQDGAVQSAQVVDTNGSGHGALAGFLQSNRVDALICGGIGGGAQMALKEAGIRLYGGVSGSADDAVTDLLAGTLDFHPDVRCSHHDHAHGAGAHHCGESCAANEHHCGESCH